MRIIQPIKLYLPNILTLINLALGTLATMEAWYGRYTLAASYVLVCIVLDFFDGYTAKMLKAFSNMGKQLDVLADLVSFSIAPGAIVSGLLKTGAINYQWPYFLLPLTYTLPLLIPVVSAIRLARFNVEQHQERVYNNQGNDKKWMHQYDASYFESWICINQCECNIRGGVCRNRHTSKVRFLMLAPLRMFSFKLKKYGLASNIWRYLFAATGIGLVIWLRGFGLFFVFIFYILASIGMSLRLRHLDERKTDF